MDFSPQQTAFINFAINDRRSCNLIAVAGAGKTTTGLEAAVRMPGQVAICAYNKKIAEEIEGKLARKGVDWRKVKAGTVHSFGFTALKKAFGLTKDDIDEFKVIDIVTGLIGEDEEVKPYATLIAKLVGLAKQAAVGILTRIEDRDAYRHLIDHFDLIEDGPDDYTVNLLTDYAIRALRANNANTRKIDFDDMVYLPVLLRCKFWQYDCVMVDEAQDTNAARRLIVKAMVKRGGRVFAIGDPCQPAGTLVHVPTFNNRHKRRTRKTIKIEEIKKGDLVVSYSVSESAVLPNGRRVNGITEQEYEGVLVNVEAGDKKTRYTPHHRCLVSLKSFSNHWGVYLMRQGEKFRVGKTRLHGNACSGLSGRFRNEKADAMWLIDVFDNETEAFYFEQSISGRFGIPQLLFESRILKRKDAAKNLPKVWSYIGDLTGKADALLSSFGRDIRFPLHSRDDKFITSKRPIITRASNLIDGMLVAPINEDRNSIKKKEWLAIKVSRSLFKGKVYSMDVDETNIYFGDGIATHNCQAIYGFTGADSESLAEIGRMFNAVELPLTISYRCPKTVVAFARQWVNHIESHPDAPEGSVSSMTFEDMLATRRRDLNANSAILCRNTRPLVSTAFALIREKIACRIEGRSIGVNLIKMVTCWKRIKSLHALRDRLDQYFATMKPKLEEARKEAKLQELDDQIETIKVIIDHCLSTGKDTVADVVAYINELFADDVKGMLTLSTIHKSKGREWPNVFWLDRANTCPSKYAKQAWAVTQEYNLMYVAATRAMANLIELAPPAPKKEIKK